MYYCWNATTIAGCPKSRNFHLQGNSASLQHPKSTSCNHVNIKITTKRKAWCPTRDGGGSSWSHLPLDPGLDFRPQFNFGRHGGFRVAGKEASRSQDSGRTQRCAAQTGQRRVRGVEGTGIRQLRRLWKPSQSGVFLCPNFQFFVSRISKNEMSGRNNP